MAKIVVENATVERVFQTQYGWGVALTETYTPKDGGDPRKSWFTAWFKDRPAVELGQIVSVSGFVSVKSKILDNGRAAADVSVRSARLIDAAPPIATLPDTLQQAASSEDLGWSDAGDPWAGDSSWA